MPSRPVIRDQNIAPEKLQRARELRKHMTPEEALLWSALRRNQLGVHFRRQQILEGFIVDFYCQAARLVIEIDGARHQDAAQRKSDMARDRVLKDLGLRVVRFKNRMISQDLPKVLQKIQELLRNPV